MKSSISFLLLVAVNIAFSQSSKQKIWTEVSKSNFKQTTRVIIPLKSKAFKLDLLSVKETLLRAPKRGVVSVKDSNVILNFPNSDGDLESFRIIEASVMSEELQLKFPNIRSYAGQGLEDPSSIIRFSISDKKGISSMRKAPGKKTSFIEMYSGQDDVFVVFDRSNTLKSDFSCSTDEKFGTKMKGRFSETSRDADTGKLHTFRLALSCTGEYGSGVGGGTIAGVLSEFNATMTRVNGIFENDFATTMIIINNTDIIHFDPTSDPYTGALNGELQAHLTAVVGEANYDIGHVLNQAGNNGNAGCIGCICVDGQKGSAFTQSNVPTGFNFDVDFVAHEMGHQFGGNHTFTQGNEGTGANLEPGSGSTIMGYAGITGSTDVQPNSDPYFHFFTIEQVTAHVASRTCDIEDDLPQTIPTVNAGNDYTIPSGTAFKLTGEGTVDSAGSISYCWEQSDIGGPGNTFPSSTDTSGPSFRSLMPSSSPIRYFPNLPLVMSGSLGSSGSPGDWEVINDVSRDYTFRLTVRDNIPGGGQNKIDDMSISVDDSNGAFSVTSQTNSTNWNAGSSEIITWNVAGTSSGAINSPFVNILFTDDNGLSFTTLIQNTPNDGSESIIVPLINTSIGRIFVESSSNIFYAVNSGEITIQTAEFVMAFDEVLEEVCEPNDAIYNFTYNTFLGYTGETTFSITGNPAGSTVVFSPNTVTADNTNVMMTISNISGASTGQYNLTVTGTGNPSSISFDSQVNLNIYDNNLDVPLLVSPSNGSTDVVSPYILNWDIDTNASSYEIEIATDLSFLTIIETDTVLTNQYTPSGLSSSTQYFWRVRANNTCLTTPYSSVWDFTTEQCTVCSSVANTDYATSTTRVILNTIDNASGKPSGYSDYTSISTDLDAGSSYDLTVNVNTDGNFSTSTLVWIDWNQNCVFDVPSEEYDLGGATNESDGATSNSALSISVPSSAISGNTIMRVTTKYANDGLPTSCENGADAEVEDYTINVIASLPDADSDGIPDVDDNCINTPNTDQADFNNNGIGDVCEDSDGDGVNDDIDNCPTVVNPGQEDADGNGQGDVCQDSDNDGIFDTVDNCPAIANPGQEDTDGNGTGDACQDTDGDGVFDDTDNCINISNTDQADYNNDGEGDVCDDTDGDGVFDDIDNCVDTPNSGQEDSDGNGVGDVCQDTDGDGVFDTVDNCINISNSGQEDWNNDGEGDACDDTDGDGVFDDIDNCINTVNTDQSDYNNDGEGDVCDDSDNDGVFDDIDNCVDTPNSGQEDTDGNGIGDVCQDTDGDGVLDLNDNCPSISNSGQEDNNNDGEGDVCDDTDGDGVFDDIDNCIDTPNSGQEDADGNGVGDVCQDTDGDGVFDDVDNCLDTPNPGQEDAEGDGVGDACQVYDADGDGVLDDVDNCIDTPNPGQEDVDGNGIGDVCQDTDSDGVLDINDNCPTTDNANQEDFDGNGIGDACQDTDSDGVLDTEDNCPLTANSNQADANNDGVGDVCESVEPADALTPNGDLQNDTWNIKNIENVNNTVKVFNRYGVKVFSALNYVNNTWGGESTEGGNGLLPAGSYYYVIDYVSTQGEAKTVTGWLYINY